MKTLLSTFLLLFVIINITASQDIVKLSDSVLVTQKIQDAGSSLTFSFQTLNVSTPLGINIIPCFGTVGYLVGEGFIPNASNYTFKQDWDSTVRQLGTTFPSVPKNTNIYIVVSSIENYGENYESASFQVLVSTDEENKYNKLVPIPAKDGDIQIKLTNGGKSGTVTFYKTGNTEDDYEIYTFTGDLPKGSFQFSSCGVRKYAVESTTNIENYGGNQASATFTGLNPSEPTGVTVIVSRRGGFSSTYNYAVLNDPSSSTTLRAQLLTLVPMIFTSLFIKFLLF
ncbi:hypothetical protein CYY_005601 [Polysphondylium violaceum]|uniref:Uncharacterized protein n=1 Tax=Polysphondylium violaceum TaxID=133409 RepID=A0A8J4PSN7_9MYCE|nr:hypothetical protein CYY_005601 [Polysphondylium violaceum]